jgi:hypothetical protein
MMPPWLVITLVCLAAAILVGMFILGCLEEARHRRASKDSTMQTMLAALRIHEAAQEARVLMMSEIRRLAEHDE